MRELAHIVFFLMLAGTIGAAKDDSVADLKARVESTRPEDRIELCIRIAQQRLRDADKFYNDGHVDLAREAIGDIVTYSERARDDATQTQKRLKNVEIDVRKIAEKLRDIKRTLAFEDQPPVDLAIHHLEDVRTSLLKEMFKDNKKKEKK